MPNEIFLHNYISFKKLNKYKKTRLEIATHKIKKID